MNLKKYLDAVNTAEGRVSEIAGRIDAHFETGENDKALALRAELDGAKAQANGARELYLSMLNATSPNGADPGVRFAPAGGVQVTLDEADRPFTNLGEQLRAVKNWETTKGEVYDPRLRRLVAPKIQDVANELVGSEGGFLVQPDFATTLLAPIHDVGPFSQRANQLPIGNNANSGSINGVDETSRATGSRWGGVRGYRLAEGALKTASDFSFREILWRLKKYAVLVVATDELLEDQTMLQKVIQTGCSEELNFMLNDDMFRGDGIGGPLGYLLSPALVTVAKEANQLADTILAENIIKMYARMYARSMNSAVWYINQDVLPQLFTMAVPVGLGGTPMYMPPGGLSGLPYSTLLGRPVVVNEFSSTLGNLGDITFADMSEYLWWEKSSPQFASSIHIYFLYDKNAFRFVYRVDGLPSWGAPLTPFQGTATTSPFVALAERA